MLLCASAMENSSFCINLWIQDMKIVKSKQKIETKLYTYIHVHTFLYFVVWPLIQFPDEFSEITDLSPRDSVKNHLISEEIQSTRIFCEYYFFVIFCDRREKQRKYTIACSSLMYMYMYMNDVRIYIHCRRTAYGWVQSRCWSRRLILRIIFAYHRHAIKMDCYTYVYHKLHVQRNCMWLRLAEVLVQEKYNYINFVCLP